MHWCRNGCVDTLVPKTNKLLQFFMERKRRGWGKRQNKPRYVVIAENDNTGVEAMNWGRSSVSALSCDNIYPFHDYETGTFD